MTYDTIEVDGETLDEYLAEHIGTTSASAAVNAPAARSTSGTGGSPVLSGLPESEVIRLLKPAALPQIPPAA